MCVERRNIHMRKTRILITLVLSLIVVFALAISVNAAAGTMTGAEWDFANGVVTFRPTEDAPEENVLNFELDEWKTFAEANASDVAEIYIEAVEGRNNFIAINGRQGLKKLRKFTWDPSLFKGDNVFKGSSLAGWQFSNGLLTTFGPKGTPEGTCDLRATGAVNYSSNSYFVKWAFASCAFTNILLPEAESFPYVFYGMFQGCNKLKEITFPANIKVVESISFRNCKNLEKIIVPATVKTLYPDAFDGCGMLYTIVGEKGSAAYRYANKYGYEFVDINTGEVLIEGTKEIIPDPESLFDWDYSSATDKGNLSYDYKGNRIVNTNWAWYADQKTIVFFDNNEGAYNETGNETAVSDTTSHWTNYKPFAEKVVFGSGLDKISSGCLRDMPRLKYVEYGSGTSQVDGPAFRNCPNLVSIYVRGNKPIEGVADMRQFQKINSQCLLNTGIETVYVKTGQQIADNALYGCKNVAISEPDDYTKAYCENNGFNLVDLDDGKVVLEAYRFIDAANLIAAGTNAIASFDKETGTLTVFGSGEIFDITNYYGGGSKNQPWFSFKNDIKKIVLGENITIVGKWAFCQCKNLEYLELSGNPITILNGAFEKCYNLKSVYETGNEPIEGTFDISSATAVEPWAFAYNYLAVNVIINEEVVELGETTFQDWMNLQAIYGVPGSYAEAYAAEIGKTFVDVSTGMPTAATATPPEMNEDERQRAEMDAEATATESETDPIFVDPDIEFGDDTTAPDTTDAPETTPTGGDAEGGNTTVIIVAVVAAVVVIAAVAVVLVILKKKKK